MNKMLKDFDEDLALRQVAEGFGVTQNDIRLQRIKGTSEYIEGVHYCIKELYNKSKDKGV